MSVPAEEMHEGEGPDASHEVPSDLIELFEVLEWEKAVRANLAPR